ncbi:hypothetical protein O0L34_g9323 [Tuta absoluta]|nr:hypothetical protein O0L34_g9323 [Tuta absoluta]
MLFCFLASTNSQFQAIRHFTKSNRLYKIPEDDDMLLFWKTSGMRRCDPFAASYVDCNKCVCGADSVLYCTRIVCTKKTDDYEYVMETLPMKPHHKKKKHKQKFRVRKRRKQRKGVS